MRPDFIREEDIVRWESARILSDELKRHAELGIQLSPEVFYAGQWLGEELDKLGVDALTGKKICFSTGQIQSGTGQSWEPAIEALERYKKDGSYEEPGEDLARKIMTETLGEDFTLEDFLEYIKDRLNLSEETLMPTLNKIASKGKPKLPPEFSE